MLVPEVLVGDPTRLRQVLGNLQNNALKFTEHGEIQVAINAVPATAGSVHLRLSVRDTGPGIPPEYRTRIFDRFVQIADRPGRRRGTGIGLNFCRLAVEAHGGQIWVDDAPDGGSEFSFTLPAVAD